MNDVNEAIYIIENNTVKKFSKYNKIYLFATENINGYIDKITGENILTICGSGDQVLSIVKNSPKKIIAFDINELSKYMMFLKLYAINSFSFDEYVEFFIYGKMDYSLFNKINFINKDIYIFWNELYKYFNYNNERLYCSNLFIKNDNSFYFRNISYLNKKHYYMVKNNILNIEISFINKDLYDLVNIKNHFNLIYLSNIGDYIDNVDVFNNYINSLSKLFSCKVIFAYLYEFCKKEKYFNKLNDPEYIKNNIDNYNIYKFDGAYNGTDAILEKEVSTVKKYL